MRTVLLLLCCGALWADDLPKDELPAELKLAYMEADAAVVSMTKQLQDTAARVLAPLQERRQKALETLQKMCAVNGKSLTLDPQTGKLMCIAPEEPKQ